jgi:hypothetical protein
MHHAAMPARSESTQVGAARPCCAASWDRSQDLVLAHTRCLSLHGAQVEAAAEAESNKKSCRCSEPRNQASGVCKSIDPRIRSLAHEWLDLFVYEAVETLDVGGALMGMIEVPRGPRGCRLRWRPVTV